MRSLRPCEYRVLVQSVNEPPLNDIADALNLSYDTVKTYRKRILIRWKTCYPQTGMGKNAFHQMVRKVAPYLGEDVP